MRTHLQRATAIMVASGGIILALAGCQLIILSGSNIDQQAEALADEFDQTKFVLVDAQDYRNATEPEPTQYAVNLRTIVFNTLYPSYIAGYLAAGTTSTGTVGVNADETFNERWQRMGILAVEMESAGLYATAAHAEVEALGMFTVLASLVPGEATTEKERETAFTPMMELALPWRRSEEGTTMKKTEVAQMIDHTLLKPEATAADVAALVAQGAELGTYSVCVSPSMLPLETPEGLMVACVAGFPSGAVKPEIKAAEATRAVEDGADEVDMVINIALVKEGREAELEAEIRAVRDAVPAPRVLKVIIESAALTDEEIVMACRASENAGADFVKTSTGFHPAGGASVHAVKLMRETVGDRLGVKASGGIRDATTALAMIEAGASRLGVSATVAILEGIEE